MNFKYKHTILTDTLSGSCGTMPETLIEKHEGICFIEMTCKLANIPSLEGRPLPHSTDLDKPEESVIKTKQS